MRGHIYRYGVQEGEDHFKIPCLQPHGIYHVTLSVVAIEIKNVTDQLSGHILVSSIQWAVVFFAIRGP